MINENFLKDIIHIHQNVETDTGTEITEDCVLVHEDIKASLGCGEGATRIFSCMVERQTERDLCIEIQPTIDLDCKIENYIIEVIRNGCNIGKYRVDEIAPIRTVRDGMYSYYILAHKICT